MLLPRLRIRLNRPVASVREASGRVAKVTALSGTKISPKPSPWMKPVRTTAHWSMSGVKRAHLPEREPRSAARPAPISSRLSILPTSRPARNIISMVPMPRGASTMPAVSTG